MRNLPINILIVDDHPALRAGLRGLLETSPAFRVVAETGNAIEALHHVKESEIDIVLMDIVMQGTNGIDLTERVRGINSSIHILIYTQRDEEEYVLRAIRAGASGYMVKTMAARDIKNTINNICDGRKVFPPINQYELMLTIRERQVFWLIGDGRSIDRIGTQLNIGIRTVEGHRTRIVQKLKTVLSDEDGRNSNLMPIMAYQYRSRCEYPQDNS